MGKSLANNREISELIGVRFGNTLFLAAYAAIIAVPLALFLGILAALYRNSVYDRLINIMTLSAISSPEFFVAYILVAWLANNLGWFPSISNVHEGTSIIERLFRTALPAMTMTLVVVAHIMPMTCASIINLLSNPHIEMA